MPQLFSRIDANNWLTPSIADILDQGANPPGGDGSIRKQTSELQQALRDAGSPVRIVNVLPTPSYTLFTAQAETTGRLGARRNITPNEIRRSLTAVADQHKEWTLGFVPQVKDIENGMGILLRTEEHKPQSLRRMLVRAQFRNHPSTLALVLGLTLDQELLIRDLDTMGHLLVIGADKAKLHIMRSLLLTLICLNTPTEIRIALVGENSKNYADFARIPHMLGRGLAKPSEAQRLLDGLDAEMARREKLLAQSNLPTIADYNAGLSNTGKLPVPRVLLIVDSLSESEWQSSSKQWTPAVYRLLTKGSALGFHLLITANQIGDLSDLLTNALTTQIVVRSAAAPLQERMKEFPRPTMRFIDALVVETLPEDRITPVEISVVSNDEVQKAVDYWLSAAQKRAEETANRATSEPTGVTGYLNPEIVNRLTQPTQAVPQHDMLDKASALAAYLGWIGIGPLHDILGLSEAEANAVLLQLRTLGIVEDDNTPTPRFIRLSENPLQR